MNYPKVWMSLSELEKQGLSRDLLKELIKRKWVAYSVGLNGGKYSIKTSTLDDGIKRLTSEYEKQH